MIRALALAACLLPAVGARSAEPERIAETPRVSATGSATRAVPVDGIRVVFRMETGAPTFAASKRQADAVFASIREQAQRSGLPELETRADFRVLDREPRIEAVEIEHVWAGLVLAAELEAVGTLAKQPPQ